MTTEDLGSIPSTALSPTSFMLPHESLDISEKYQYRSLTGFNQAIANCKRQSLSTQK